MSKIPGAPRHEKIEPLMTDGQGVVNGPEEKPDVRKFDSQGLPILTAEEIRELKDSGTDIIFPGQRFDGERRRF